MARTRTTSRDRSSGAFSISFAVGAAAATAAAAATDLTDSPATSAGIVGLAAAAAAYVASHLFVISASREREQSSSRLVLETQSELREQNAARAGRRELDRALDQAEDETAALVVARHALARHFPERPIEVHLVDPVEPILTVEIALSRPDEALGHRTLPWEPLATRSVATLTYASTQRLDVCHHLRARAGHPKSAIAVPLTATGRILGLIYAFGPDGETPDPADVLLFEEFASAIASRLAVTRTSESSIHTDSIDRLTGLPDRPAMQQQVIRLLAERVPFSVAITDIDEFSALNREHGRAAADAALSLLGRVSRQAIRPDDLVGRVGGDELLFVMPNTAPADATRAIDRIREELFVNQSATEGTPRFTMSVGIVGSAAGLTIDSILKTAAAALRAARHAGGNRIVVGEPVSEPG